jgi:Papain-like cysteine protease AvrRpt2
MLLSRRSLIGGLVLLEVVAMDRASAQVGLPPVVDLGIINIPQQEPEWCWLAVSEQIIRWKRGGQSPLQCQMASLADNFPPGVCCLPPNPAIAQICGRGGALPEIQALIARFGATFSQITPPTDPMTLYQILRAGHPVIVALQETPYAGHVVVVRGMDWLAGGPVLFVNDPMSYFTQPVPFQSLVFLHWDAGIIVL